MNHFCIRVRDPAKSLHFYLDLMGMRTVFTVNGGPLTVYFLGYPQSDRHRQDPSLFSTETVPQLTDGLLELYHVHGSETQPEGYYSNGHTPPYLGFCHLGFTVPSTQMSVMIERFKENQVEFFKNLGEASSVQNIPISEWELARGVGLGEFVPEFAKVNKQIIFVKDPVSSTSSSTTISTPISRSERMFD